MFFFFQAEDGIRDYKVTGVQTCALPICILICKRSGVIGMLRSTYRRSTIYSRNPHSNTLDCRRVDRKSTRLNSSHLVISYAVFCLKKKQKESTPRVASIMENTNLSRQQQVSEIMRQMLTQAQTAGDYFFF